MLKNEFEFLKDFPWLTFYEKSEILKIINKGKLRLKREPIAVFDTETNSFKSFGNIKNSKRYIEIYSCTLECLIPYLKTVYPDEWDILDVVSFNTILGKKVFMIEDDHMVVIQPNEVSIVAKGRYDLPYAKIRDKYYFLSECSNGLSLSPYWCLSKLFRRFRNEC